MKKKVVFLSVLLACAISMVGCQKSNTDNQESVIFEVTNEKYRSVLDIEIPMFDIANSHICMNEKGYVLSERTQKETKIHYTPFYGNSREIISFDQDTIVRNIDTDCDDVLYVLIKTDPSLYKVVLFDLTGRKIEEKKVVISDASTEDLDTIKVVNGLIYLAGKNCIYKLDKDGNISYVHREGYGSDFVVLPEGVLVLLGNGERIEYALLDADTLTEKDTISYKEGKAWYVGKNGLYYIADDFFVEKKNDENDLAIYSVFDLNVDITGCFYFSDCKDGNLYYAQKADDSVSLIMISNHDVVFDKETESVSEGSKFRETEAESENAATNSGDSGEKTDEREILSLLSVNAGHLQGYVSSFNKKNEDYRIKMLPEVSDWNMYPLKLVSEKYDVFEIDDVSYPAFADKGLMLDISEYLDSSTIIKKEDYFDSVINEYTIDGKIYALPKLMSLSTLLVPTKLLEGKESWNVDEYLDFMEKYPNSLSRDYFDTPAEIKNLILRYIVYGVVKDLQRGEAFDKEALSAVLERINDLPVSVVHEEEKKRIKNGEPLIFKRAISTPDELSRFQSEVENEVTLIGYPTFKEGLSAGLVSHIGILGISSKTENPQAAWAVVEDYMSRGVGTNSFEMSTKKVEFEEQAQIGTDRETITLDGVTYVPVTDSDIEKIKKAYTRIVSFTDDDREIFDLVLEVSDRFFNGEISSNQASDDIMSRLAIFNSERD